MTATPAKLAPADQQTQLLLGVALLAGALVLLPVLVVALPLAALWSRARLPWWLVLALAVAVGGLTSLVRPVDADGYLALLLALVRDAAPAVQASEWPVLRALLPPYAVAFAPYALTAGPPLAAALTLRRWWWPGAGTPDRLSDTNAPHKGGVGRSDAQTLEPKPLHPAVMRGEDFAVLAGEPAPALWGECLEEGSVTLVPGVPKAGKSELLAGLVGSVVAGRSAYLGWPLHTRPGGEPVVVLCEETPRTYRHKALRMAGLEARTLRRWQRVRWTLLRPLRTLRAKQYGRPDIHIIPGPLAGEKSAETIREHLQHAVRVAFASGARLIVLDSIKHWCPTAVTQDAAAGVLMDACREVAAMTNPRTKKGLIVVPLHHLSEKDGHMLGPTTLFSQADFRLSIAPPDGKTVQETSERVVTPEGRFDGMGPGRLGYRMVADADGATRLEPSTVVPSAPRPTAPPKPKAPPPDLKVEGRRAVLAWLGAQADPARLVPIKELLAARVGGMSESTCQARLKELREAGQVETQPVGRGLGYRLPHPA